jgi:hypothetical protein
MSLYRPLGLAELVVLAAFLNTAFARIPVRESQVSLVAGVFILGTFLASRSKRRVVAAVLLSATAYKPTFTPLYFVYYLVLRQFRVAALAGVLAVLLTVGPLLATQRPVVETLRDWVTMLTFMSSPGTLDDPSPFYALSAEMLNLSPLIYRILDSYTPISVSTATALTFGLCVYSFYAIKYTKQSSHSLLNFSIVSALSLVCFYHRPYDVFLLFPGLVAIYAHAANHHVSTSKARWYVFLVVVLFLLSLPIDSATRLAVAYPALLDQYVFRVIAPYQAWIGLAVVLCLLWMKRRADDILPLPTIRSSSAS